MSRVRIPSPAPFLWNNLSGRGVSHTGGLDDGWIPSVVHTFRPVLAASSVRVVPLSDRLATPAAFPPGGNRSGRRLGIGLGHHHITRPGIAPRLMNRDRKGAGCSVS